MLCMQIGSEQSMRHTEEADDVTYSLLPFVYTKHGGACSLCIKLHIASYSFQYSVFQNLNLSAMYKPQVESETSVFSFS